MKTERYYICFELGGTNIRLAIVDEQFNVCEYHKLPTTLLSMAPNKIEFFKEHLSPLVEKVGKENAIAISMTLTSLVDKDCRYVYVTPMVEGMSDLPLADEVEKIFGLPVVLAKDVNALMLYEMSRVEGDKDGIVMGIFLGTGFGNALAIDGKVYKGYTGSACELGHISIPGEERICGCGKKGCWEFKASGLRLKQLADEIGCDIANIFVEYGEDSRVKEIVEYFALAISYQVAMLDPNFVILGGGIVSMKNFPLQELIDTIKINLRAPNPRESLRVVLASSDDMAGVVGAALNASAKGLK